MVLMKYTAASREQETGTQKTAPGSTEGGCVAVEEGFEPSKGCPLPAFEAGAIGH